MVRWVSSDLRHKLVAVLVVPAPPVLLLLWYAAADGAAAAGVAVFHRYGAFADFVGAIGGMREAYC